VVACIILISYVAGYNLQNQIKNECYTTNVASYDYFTNAVYFIKNMQQKSK